MGTNNKRQIEANKQFKPQASLLTTLIGSNSHIRTLYNIILAVVAVFVVTTIGDYLLNPDRFKRDYAIMCWNVRDFYPHFLVPWALMNCSLLFVLYPLVCIRHLLQQRQLKKLVQSQRKDHNCTDDSQTELIFVASRLPLWQSTILNLVYVAISALGVVGLCSWYIVRNNVSISISFALTMEMTRLVMKAHSYFVEKYHLSTAREEGAKLVKAAASQRQRNSLPRFQALLYYLFAPTLIYRDVYPRTEKIRWNFVLVMSIQMLLSILVAFVAINRFLVDSFSQTGYEKFMLSHLARNIGGFFIFGVILNMINFYAFLHVWHNITAELLKFGDRRFYDEWWHSVSLNEYYRKWNILVQDWLYAYIYVPVYNRTANRSLAIYSVIFISGVAHEYIIGFSIRFFFPLLFVVFAIGGHFYFLATRNLKRANVHNTLFLLSNMLGWGLLSTVYSVEWYSRTNCPVQENSSLTEHLMPRLVSCVKVS